VESQEDAIVLWAIKVLGYDLSNLELWLPLGVGIGAGLLSVAALAMVSRRKAARQLTQKSEQLSPNSDPFVQGSACEQRRALRRVGNPVKVFLASAGEDTPKASAWVLDRSVGGLCLSSEQEHPVGTTIRVLPASAPDIAYWVDVEVRSCRSVKGGFELGCQFVKTPPWSILLLFG
jgi:hypothetical protein